MNIKESIKNLSVFEWGLWGASVIMIIASVVVSGRPDWLSVIGSLIGVTALIFVAKGDVLGQILTIVFSIFYGIVSISFQYYGEMITYMFMTAPIALLSVVSWIRHPYKGKQTEVEVHHLSVKEGVIITVLSIIVAGIFFFVLRALGNNNLVFSTISITTSFLASALMFRRSSYYALAYGANDIVLIVLWVMASIEDKSYIPMIVCFSMFLLNDLYGFFNWSRMKKRQQVETT